MGGRLAVVTASFQQAGGGAGCGTAILTARFNDLTRTYALHEDVLVLPHSISINSLVPVMASLNKVLKGGKNRHLKLVHNGRAGLRAVVTASFEQYGRGVGSHRKYRNAYLHMTYEAQSLRGFRFGLTRTALPRRCTSSPLSILVNRTR